MGEAESLNWPSPELAIADGTVSQLRSDYTSDPHRLYVLTQGIPETYVPGLSSEKVSVYPAGESPCPEKGSGLIRDFHMYRFGIRPGVTEIGQEEFMDYVPSNPVDFVLFEDTPPGKPEKFNWDLLPAALDMIDDRGIASLVSLNCFLDTEEGYRVLGELLEEGRCDEAGISSFRRLVPMVPRRTYSLVLAAKGIIH